MCDGKIHHPLLPSNCEDSSYVKARNSDGDGQWDLLPGNPKAWHLNFSSSSSMTIVVTNEWLIYLHALFTVQLLIPGCFATRNARIDLCLCAQKANWSTFSSSFLIGIRSQANVPDGAFPTYIMVVNPETPPHSPMQERSKMLSAFHCKHLLTAWLPSFLLHMGKKKGIAFPISSLILDGPIVWDDPKNIDCIERNKKCNEGESPATSMSDWKSDLPWVKRA